MNSLPRDDRFPSGLPFQVSAQTWDELGQLLRLAVRCRAGSELHGRLIREARSAWNKVSLDPDQPGRFPHQEDDDDLPDLS